MGKSIVPENRFSFIRFHKTPETVSADLPLSTTVLDKAQTVTLTQQGYRLNWIADFEVQEAQIFESESGSGGWNLIGVTSGWYWDITDVYSYFKVVLVKKNGGYVESNSVRHTTTFSITNISYKGVTSDWSTSANGSVRFNPDGTKVFFMDATTTITSRYLRKPFDVSESNGADVGTFNFTTQDTVPKGFFISPDGKRLFMVGNTGNAIYQYTFGTAWDVDTLAYDSKSFSVSTQNTTPEGIWMDVSGTKCFIVGNDSDEILRYDLSTAWDISTASFTNQGTVTSEETNPTGLHLSPNGKKLFVVGTTNDEISEYDLTTAWDLTTLTLNQQYDISSQTSTAASLTLSPSGDRAYTFDSSGIYQFNL